MIDLRDVKPEARDIPIDLIDPPALAARLGMDEEKLRELTQSVQRIGVRQRLAVVKTGERFEIIAGHRRYCAATAAGLVALPCDVYPTKDAALEAIKYAENRFREDMSAAEEAIYFDELLERDHGGDIEALAAALGEKRSYVDARICLFRGNREVFEALAARKITIGVAQELNRLKEADWVHYYLELAIRDQSPVSTVHGYIEQHKRLYGGPTPPAAPQPAVSSEGPKIDSYNPLRCYVCGRVDHHVPEQISVHSHCRKAILDELLQRNASPAE